MVLKEKQQTIQVRVIMMIAEELSNLQFQSKWASPKNSSFYSKAVYYVSFFRHPKKKK